MGKFGVDGAAREKKRLQGAEKLLSTPVGREVGIIVFAQGSRRFWFTQVEGIATATWAPAPTLQVSVDTKSQSRGEAQDTGEFITEISCRIRQR